MDWNNLIKEFDKESMLKYLEAFPQQFKEALEVVKKYNVNKKDFSNIVICGMGGSGIGGTVIKNLLKKEIKIPIEVINDYELPAFVDKNSLVITVSYSGNTEEIVACFREAKEKNATAIAITTGGILADLQKDCLLVPKAVPQPRLAFAYLFTSILILLEKFGLVKDKEAELVSAIKQLEENRKKIDEESKSLALELKDKNPVIYAQAEFSSIIYRFCTEINENAKQFCHSQFIPEMNHNEINIRHKSGEVVLVLLRDRKERKRIAERFKISKKLWSKNFKVKEIFVEGDTLLARMLYAVWLESLTAYYLALLNKENPMEIPSIIFLKTSLKEVKK